MFSGNFRVLIFIDLLATAMGGSLILMMILSINRNSQAPPAGAARNFVFYKVWADDPDAYLKVVVRNGDKSKWVSGTIPELSYANDKLFLIADEEASIFAWGPVTEYDAENNKTRNVYNVYSTAAEAGDWVFGVLYYNNGKLNRSQSLQADAPLTIHHALQTIDLPLTETVSRTSLGNYSFRRVALKPQER